MPNHGESFLHNQDDSLHTSEPVEHEQARRAIASLHDTTNQVEPIDSEISHNLGDEVHTKPADKIADFLRVLEHTHTSHSDDPRVLDRIKASYHKTHVIKPEAIPESTFELEQQIARNMGHGDIPITEEFRQAKIEHTIRAQEHSLDKWVDYLTSSDATYPMWAKYWAFTSITKMGKLEKSVIADESGNEHESIRFARRTKDTVAPFPPLNPRALALTISVIDERLSQKGLPKLERTPVANQSTKLNDEDFRELIISESFSRIYSQFLLELPQYSTEGLKETRGEWKKYPQGSDPDELVDSLDGYPLEWCTADPETARGQLAGGDFYVYYSIDQDGNPVIPRVAIRMQGGRIAEVRGIAPGQNTDPFIAPVIEAKMEDFPDGKVYQKRSQDMARLTDITQRVETGAELTKADLRFLYEIDSPIQGFGYQKDPRISEVLKNRDARADLVYVLDIPPDQISLSDDEALSGTPDHPILFHHGNLNLNSLTSAEGLNLPQSIGGYLSLDRLTSAEGLSLPQSIGDYLDLRSLTSAEGLNLPQSIGGSLNLGRLTSAEGLNLPQSIGGYLDLDSLTSAEGLNLPQSIGDSLNLDSLTSAEGLNLPQSIGGNLSLYRLTSAEGLNLPQNIGGGLNLASLTSAEGLSLPQSIGDYLDLYSLTSAEGLNLPQSIGGYLDLYNLTSAEGLSFPQSIGDYLDLYSLTSAEGLNLPQSIGGYLFLHSLTSAEGLNLPQNIGGYLSLDSLTSAEKQRLRQHYPELAIN